MSSVRTKQVIVIRRDLGMRRGKGIAQGSHAAMAFLTRRLADQLAAHAAGGTVAITVSEVEAQWLTISFAKVCLQVQSEEELIEVEARARAAGLEVHVVVDSGRTEFHGQPTRTCLAIGPDEAERIDAVTGDLKLY
jgi:PTH2 family peptidyl-tRNA hydrolase